MFERSSAGWTEVTKLLASDGAADDAFSLSVAISGDIIVVGASRDDDNGSDSGSVKWSSEFRAPPRADSFPDRARSSARLADRWPRRSRNLRCYAARRSSTMGRCGRFSKRLSTILSRMPRRPLIFAVGRAH